MSPFAPITLSAMGLSHPLTGAECYGNEVLGRLCCNLVSSRKIDRRGALRGTVRPGDPVEQLRAVLLCL
jgi:hypothetical protein